MNSLERKIDIRSVLKFTLPSIVMMVVMSLYTVVDGTFVSRLVGTNAFSAVNIVYPMLSVTIGLGAMFGTGTTAIVAMKMGAGRQREACETLTFIVLVTIGIGAVSSLVSLVYLKEILYALGANDTIYEDCWNYALPLVFFFMANILQIQFQALYVADGKPQVGLVVTIAGGLANVVLDYVFIAWFHMGIAGAAAATGIGYSIPALYGLFYFGFNRKGSLHFVRPRINMRALGHAASNGSSEMVNYLSTSITTFLFNIIMMRLVGPDGVAAIAILLYLDFVLIAISLGYSMGVAPLISYYYGADRAGELKRLFRISAGFCGAVGIVMTSGTVLFAEQLAGIFTGRGTAVFELAAAGLRIYAFGYLFKSYNVFASAMFTAYGNGVVSAILSFMRTLVFLVVSLIGLSVLFGVEGVWYASPAAELPAMVLALYYTVKYRKKYRYWESGDRLAWNCGNEG